MYVQNYRSNIYSDSHSDQRLLFKVVTYAQMVNHIRDYKHVIIDTEGNSTDDDFKDLSENCDLLVIPVVPESVATDGLTHTLAKLHSLKNNRYKVLLTMVPPASTAPPHVPGGRVRHRSLCLGADSAATKASQYSLFALNEMFAGLNVPHSERHGHLQPARVLPLMCAYGLQDFLRQKFG